MAQEIVVQSQVELYQKLKKGYLISPCLTLCIISYVSRIKWSNPGKGVAPFPPPQCSSYWKRSLWLPLTMVANFTFIYIYIYIYIKRDANVYIHIQTVLLISIWTNRQLFFNHLVFKSKKFEPEPISIATDINWAWKFHYRLFCRKYYKRHSKSYAINLFPLKWEHSFRQTLNMCVESLFVWLLWHINLCRLFNAKSIFIQINTSISNNSIMHK